MKKQEMVKICPKCSSIDVTRDITVLTAYTPQQWKCNNCQYQSLIFPEIDLNELNKKIKKNDETKEMLK